MLHEEESMLNLKLFSPEWVFAMVIAAAGVLGLETWIKRWFKDMTTPWWAWHLALLPLSAVAGLAVAGLEYSAIICALTVLTLTQLAYKPLVALPEAWVKKAAGEAVAVEAASLPGSKP